MIRLGAIAYPRGIGQETEDWKLRAQKAVLKYEDLSKKVDSIQDTEKAADILAWMGPFETPGSPAERYQAVKTDIAEDTSWTEMGIERIKQFEGMVADLEGKVNFAMETYGSLPAPDGAGGQTEEASATMLCITGGIGLLGAIVLPLFLE